MREVAEASLRLSDGACNWSIVAFPNEGWATTVFGEPDVERLWAGGRDGRPPRRARSGRGLARAHREARPPRRRAERAPLRRAPLPRAGHRPHGRAAPGRRLARRARRVERDRARREHADRGGLHRPRRAPRRRDGPRDVPAPDPGHDRPRPRGALRGRPRGRGPRRRGRGADAHARRDGRRRARASARSRSSTPTPASAGPGSSSTTRSSTRTPPRTSPSAMAIVKAVDGRRELSPEERHERGVNHSSIHTDFMIGSPRARRQRRHEGRRRGADPARRRLGSLAVVGAGGLEPPASCSQSGALPG